MYISYHQTPNYQVIDNSGTYLTNLNKIWVNFNDGKVLAFETKLHSKNLIHPSDIIAWDDSKVILGPNFEFLEVTDLIRLENLLTFKNPKLISKKVFTESGLNIGQVIDFNIDTNSLILANILVSKVFWIWKTDKRSINYSQIIEINSDKIIVKDNTLKIPVSQSFPEQFVLQKTATLDQALFERED